MRGVRTIRWAAVLVDNVKTYVVVPKQRPCVMKTVQEVRELLNSEDAPDEMVAYEFSGALLEARRATGASVMSVDRRAPEHDGWHYQGDLRDIIALRVWLVIFFVGPPCFQHMERDDCLEAKIDDMRAFWAGVTVWWCVTCPYALSVLVEQPNTIGHRFVDAGRLEGVQVHHLRTGTSMATRLTSTCGSPPGTSASRAHRTRTRQQCRRARGRSASTKMRTNEIGPRAAGDLL